MVNKIHLWLDRHLLILDNLDWASSLDQTPEKYLPGQLGVPEH